VRIIACIPVGCIPVDGKRTARIIATSVAQSSFHFFDDKLELF